MECRGSAATKVNIALNELVPTTLHSQEVRKLHVTSARRTTLSLIFGTKDLGDNTSGSERLLVDFDVGDPTTTMHTNLMTGYILHHLVHLS